MNLVIIAAALALTDSEAGAQATGGWMEWGQYSRTQSLPRRDGVEQVTIYSAFSGPDAWKASSSKSRVWIARRETSGVNQAPRVQYAESRTCPAFLPHLQALEQLIMPVIDAPQPPAALGISVPPRGLVVDGADYVLEAPALFGAAMGRVRLRSNFNTPVAEWVNGALEGWRGCWRAEMPVLD